MSAPGRDSGFPGGKRKSSNFHLFPSFHVLFSGACLSSAYGPARAGLSPVAVLFLLNCDCSALRFAGAPASGFRPQSQRPARCRGSSTPERSWHASSSSAAPDPGDVAGLRPACPRVLVFNLLARPTHCLCLRCRLTRMRFHRRAVASRRTGSTKSLLFFDVSTGAARTCSACSACSAAGEPVLQCPALGAAAQPPRSRRAARFDGAAPLRRCAT